MNAKDLHPRMLIYLQQSGLFPAIFVCGFKVYLALIQVLIEHWRPKTHTIHFPSGETMITLEDVAYQLGVPMNGAHVVRQNNYEPKTLVYEVLGKVSLSECIDGYRVRMTWLESEFQVTNDEVIFVSRTYLLRLIGGILLPNKSGNFAHT
ncbi:protein MAINTENANCE OF MERISTEMS-like [Hibiscus syriacus]|uniref:protein MAINTENANCE OF MERISTEMS-like n=1 Tax=Hibiscus syriacus TaxID=106335 RepID=UPI001923C583|nr:protein MAINTENANCE OF MERISTEMS-like [Hibiscus syriacus]